MASNKPAIKRIKVVFPAPSGPTNAVKQPFRILKSKWSNAIIGPSPTRGNSLYNCDASIAYTSFTAHLYISMETVAGIPKRRRLSGSSTYTRTSYTSVVRTSFVSTDLGVNSATEDIYPIVP